MIEGVSVLLMGFKECFSRMAAFEWFVAVIAGFLFRLDHHGVTSTIRWLALKPCLYTTLLSFFRASSWRLTEIMERWRQIVMANTPLVQIQNRQLLIGDGIKVPKESRKMPGVKMLHQESGKLGVRSCFLHPRCCS